MATYDIKKNRVFILVISPEYLSLLVFFYTRSLHISIEKTFVTRKERNHLLMMGVVKK